MTWLAMDSIGVRRRFLVLHALRWVPAGLFIPVFVLLVLERGLTLGQLGVAFAAQGIMVMLLELPTGGLADAIGRRPLLLVATTFALISTIVLIFADSLVAFALSFAFQGIYRALESGPLVSWYVDTAQALDPDADIERGISLGGVVVGLAIGGGAVLGSVLVWLDPVAGANPLVIPLYAALVVTVIALGAITLLMEEHRPTHREGVRDSLVAVPMIVRQAVVMVRASRVLLALVGVELLWGFGMVSFEGFTPAKLDAVIGEADRAAVILGPTTTIAWVVASVGAASVPLLTRRWRPSVVGAGLLVAQAVAVVAIALAVGPVGVVLAYVATLGFHGAANPVHQGMLHRAVVDASKRATVVSASSMTASMGGMLGGILLGYLADATSLTTALIVGGGVLALAAPLFLAAGRQTTDREAIAAGSSAGPRSDEDGPS
jgi:MFS family permease